jgi:hypothetical protein
LGELSIIQYLIEPCRVNVNVQTNTDEYAPIHFAVQSGRLEIVRYFFENCSSTDLFLKTVHGEIILHIASEFDHIWIAHYIIERQQQNATNTGTQNPIRVSDLASSVATSSDCNDERRPNESNNNNSNINKSTQINIGTATNKILYMMNFNIETPYDIAVRKGYNDLAEFFRNAMESMKQQQQVSTNKPDDMVQDMDKQHKTV